MSANHHDRSQTTTEEHDQDAKVHEDLGRASVTRRKIRPRSDTTLINHVAAALAREAGWVTPLMEMEAEFVLGYQRRAQAAIIAMKDWEREQRLFGDHPHD